jgi:hypothetical protein
VLGIGNPSDAARPLDEDEKDTLDNVEGDNFNGLGTVGAMPTIINESGLYSLILRSRKPEAKRFKKWVTAEALPSIRKTGSYAVRALSIAAPQGRVQNTPIITPPSSRAAPRQRHALAQPRENCPPQVAGCFPRRLLLSYAKVMQMRQTYRPPRPRGGASVDAPADVFGVSPKRPAVLVIQAFRR